jgi:hypothetical protein
MSIAARTMEELVADHVQRSLAAHRQWAEAQEAIAAEFEQRVAGLCAWRIQAMSDADSRYRADHGTATSLLVHDLPQNVRLALEGRSRFCSVCGEELPDGQGHAHFGIGG